jgi:hypothetical protein
MHLVYVDESGDPGMAVSSSRYFILCGLLVHHADWHDVRSQLKDLRERLKSMHGLCPDAEIHAAEFLSSSRNHLGLNQRQRIQCLLHLLGFLERTQKLKPFRVSIDKLTGNNDPLATSWSALAIKVTNLVEISVHEKCTAEGIIIISDDLRPSPGGRWIKQALLANPKLEKLLIDLPFGRESHQSDLLQLSDLLSFLTKQTLIPNHFFSGPGGKALLRRYHRLWKAENDKGR